MSLFPDQCVDDILKNGRRRFANHSGCCKLHYDAILLMSKNNVPGWGGNRIRASTSWTQSWTFSDFRKTWKNLGIHLWESFTRILWPHFFFFFFLVVWKEEIGLHHNKVTCPSFHRLRVKTSKPTQRQQVWAVTSSCFCSPTPIPPSTQWLGREMVVNKDLGDGNVKIHAFLPKEIHPVL